MHQPLCCPSCGLELPANRLAGLCPACTWRGVADVLSDEPLERAVEAAANRSFPESSLGESALGDKADAAQSLMRIGGYQILSEIARGGMGIVYRARQLDPARTVALKMLLPHLLGSAGTAERFRLEVRALTELEHAAILPVYQV